MALLPGRLATDSVTAGSSARLAAGRSPGAVQDVLRRLLGGIRHLGHLAEVHRVALVDAHHRRGHVVGAGEERAGLDDDVAVFGRQRPGDLLPIGRTERSEQIDDAQPARSESGRIEMEPDLPSVTADEGGLRDLGDVFDLGIDLRGDPPQGQMVVTFGVEGQREDRHVVDRSRLDQRRGRSGRYPLGVRL